MRSFLTCEKESRPRAKRGMMKALLVDLASYSSYCFYDTSMDVGKRTLR
jgi:hypothetical protein